MRKNLETLEDPYMYKFKRTVYRLTSALSENLHVSGGYVSEVSFYVYNTDPGNKIVPKATKVPKQTNLLLFHENSLECANNLEMRIRYFAALAESH